MTTRLKPIWMITVPSRALTFLSESGMWKKGTSSRYEYPSQEKSARRRVSVHQTRRADPTLMMSLRETVTRKIFCVLAAGVLILPLVKLDAAQDSPTQKRQALSAPLSAVGTPDGDAQSGQPISLGELARRTRVQKSGQAKAVRIFDDENMPRAPKTGARAPDLKSAGAPAGGKVTLSDFWASWCGPCRQALPGLKQLAAVYRSDRFEVISISEDEDQTLGAISSSKIK